VSAAAAVINLAIRMPMEEELVMSLTHATVMMRRMELYAIEDVHKATVV
jgi:hypothetical protein